MGLDNLLVAGISLLAGAVLLLSGLASGIGARLLLTGALTLISTLMGSATGRGGLSRSPTYGWDYLSNQARDGSPLPVIYGEHQVAPGLVGVNVKNDGTTQNLFMLFAVCEGEIDSIDQVRIDDEPLDAFPGATTTIRLGTADQAAIPDFSEVGIPWDASTRLTKGTTHVHEMRVAADALKAGFSWPSGMYGLEDGDPVSKSYGTMVEWKDLGAPDSAYKAFRIPKDASGKRIQGPFSEDGTAGIWKTEAKTGAALRRTLEFPLDGLDGRPGRGRYVFKFTGTEDDTPARVRVPTVELLLEILHDLRAYPNVALLSVKIPASGQLSGGMPRITCVVRGRKCYDPRTGTIAWTQNPFVCLRDFLLATRYGLGQWLTSGDVDDGVGASWRVAMDRADSTVTPVGSTATEARHQLDYVMDLIAPANEQATQILSGARASMFSAQGKVRIALDVPLVGDVDRAFEHRLTADAANRRNIVDQEDGAGGLRASLTERILASPDRTNAIRVTYTDRYKGWQKRSIEVRDRYVGIGAISGAAAFLAGEALVFGDGQGGTATYSASNGATYLTFVQKDGASLPASGVTVKGATSGALATLTTAPYDQSPERIQEIQLFGVTRRTQIARETRYHLNRAHRTPRFASWAVFLGDLDVLPGCIVSASIDFCAYASKAFTVLATGFDHDGQGVVEAREYDADVYVDNVDEGLVDVTAVPPPAGTGGTTSSTPSTPPATPSITSVGSLFDPALAGAAPPAFGSPTPTTVAKPAPAPTAKTTTPANTAKTGTVKVTASWIGKGVFGFTWGGR